jgi:hypothetical protein
MANKYEYGIRFPKTDNSILGFTTDNKAEIQIQHLLSGNEALFYAFITTFSDDHQSEWNEESVYGRMDDTSTFRRTKRVMTIEFDVPSYSQEEALKNLEELAKLKKFLYPAYEKVGGYASGNALAISASPFLRVRFLNYAASAINPEKGLLCTAKNVNFSPNQEIGEYFFKGQIIPKLFKISLSLSIFHEHTTGWVKDDSGTYIFGGISESPINNNYPYYSPELSVLEVIGGSLPTDTSQQARDAAKRNNQQIREQRAQKILDIVAGNFSRRQK